MMPKQKCEKKANWKLKETVENHKQTNKQTNSLINELERTGKKTVKIGFTNITGKFSDYHSKCRENDRDWNNYWTHNKDKSTLI